VLDSASQSMTVGKSFLGSHNLSTPQADAVTRAALCFPNHENFDPVLSIEPHKAAAGLFPCFNENDIFIHTSGTFEVSLIEVL